MKKKILSAALALCLVFGSAAALPKNVFVDSTNITASAVNTATSGKCGEHVNWSLKDGVLTISGIGNMADYDFSSTPFNGRTDIKSVVIKPGVTSIGNNAFTDCTLITSVTIPDGVTFIGIDAFYRCSSLKSATIPGSTSVIGYQAFYGCTSLKSVSISNGVTAIGLYAFQNCKNLTDVNIPNSVTAIGDWAFGDCLNLTRLTVPESVTSIGEYAFGYDSEGLTIPDFKIYGVKGTAAENYAKEKALKFVAIPKTTRLSGSSRYVTSTVISKAAYPTTTSAVFLASGENFADALAGVPLANAYKAPILLTKKNSLPPATLEEIKRLKATKIYILGGDSAVSENVVKTLTDNGFKTSQIERIAGKTRYATAKAIAEKLKETTKKAPTEVFFAYAKDYADALSVSSVAAAKNAPIIYLSTNGELNEYTSAYLADLKKGKSVKNAYVIGGDKAISDDMMTKAGKALGVTPKRISGKNRYGTCVEVNTKFASVLTGKPVCVATGRDYPDALAGGVLAAKEKTPLFLVNKTLNEDQTKYLKSKKADSIYVFGGTNAVSDTLVQSIAKESV